MRKPLLLFAVLLYGAGLLAQQPGDDKPAQKTLQSFSKWYAVDAPDSIYTLFSDTLRSRLTPDTWRATLPQLKIVMGDLGAFTLSTFGEGYTNYVAVCSADSSGLVLSIDSKNHIQGIFRQPKASARPIGRNNYRVQTPAGILVGTIETPFDEGKRKPPVVLIIAGSGPIDRDGNSARAATDSYRKLAESLRLVDIASFRYDKRFIGESNHFSGSRDSLVFEDYVNDARACIRQLKADPRFSSVIVLGHSEGALVGAMAARAEKADGYISLSGAGVPAEAVLKRQLDAMRLESPDAARQTESMLKHSEHYISSWNKYDPAVEIAKLAVDTRIAIIQGLRDLQVGKADAEKLSAAAPKAWVVYMDSMNHVLKTAPADRSGNLTLYNDPEARLYVQLVPTIESFIREPEERAKGCSYSKWVDKRDAGDGKHIKFVKKAVDSLTAILTRCGERNDFKYPADYKDIGFEITVPADMHKLSFQSGNNDFGVRMDDSAYKRTIVVYYDFDGSMLDLTSHAVGKAMIKGREILLFNDQSADNKMVGRIYLDHHIVVDYYIADRTFEKQLQEAIASFKFISDSRASR